MEKKVYFRNSRGDKLCGILSTPSDNKNRLLVILVHGFNSSKNTKNFVSLKGFLDDHDIHSFRIDLFAHGESEGEFERLTISEAIDDILQAIKFVKSLGYQKLGLVGSSFGGISSANASIKTHDLSFLVLKSPVSDFEEVFRLEMSPEKIEEWKKKGFTYRKDGKSTVKVGYEFFEDSKDNLVYNIASRMTIPTLIVHGDEDESVPVSQSMKTAKLIPNCKLVLIKGSDHTYTKEEHARKMLQAISAFIMKQNGSSR